MNKAVSKFWPAGRLFAFLVVVLAAFAPFVSAQDTAQTVREAMYERYLEFASYVKGGSIVPHWMADGSSFWYAEAGLEGTVIWKVDPQTNIKEPLFDTLRLHKALLPLLSHEPSSLGLPFEDFTFVDTSENVVRFTVEEWAKDRKFDLS
ncbi:MAG: hypothetical protein IIA17_11275, partial [candidate division Zixibacteria bacterium]|nr:hypothetical protein [candidate division Zixibacteria bacterium]